MEKKEKHMQSKISVVIIGILVILYAVFYAFMCIAMYKDLENPFLLLYGAIPLAMFIGIIIAVKMRINEISKGELDEAKKY